MKITKLSHLGNEFVSVAAGHRFSLALKKDGTLWGWGENDYGQLGDGTYIDKEIPTMIMENVSSLSANGSVSSAITNDWALWVWGSFYDEFKRKLQGNCTPRKILSDVISVSIGLCRFSAVKKDGSLWVWGSNYHHLLGKECFDSSEDWINDPLKILDNIRISNSTFYNTAAITNESNLVAWGSNAYRQLGYPLSEDLTDIPDCQIGIVHHEIESGFALPREIGIQEGALCSNHYSNIIFPLLNVDKAIIGQTSFVLFKDQSLWINRSRSVYEDQIRFEIVCDNVIDIATELRLALVLRADRTLWSLDLFDYGSTPAEMTFNTKNYLNSQIRFIMNDVTDFDINETHYLVVDNSGFIWENNLLIAE